VFKQRRCCPLLNSTISVGSRLAPTVVYMLYVGHPNEHDWSPSSNFKAQCALSKEYFRHISRALQKMRLLDVKISSCLTSSE